MDSFPYSICSLVVSVLDSPAVDPRSNPGSGSALLMSEKSQAVYYISSSHMLIDRGAKQGGVGGSQPPLNFGWGVEHLSTPPDFEKKFFRGG